MSFLSYATAKGFAELPVATFELIIIHKFSTDQFILLHVLIVQFVLVATCYYIISLGSRIAITLL